MFLLILTATRMPEITTKVKTSVVPLIAVGVIGVGLAAGLLVFSRNDTTTTTNASTSLIAQPALVLDLDVKDIVGVTIEAGLPPAGTTVKPIDLTLHAQDTSIPAFGTYGSGANYTFVHGAASATSQPLVLTFAYKPNSDFLLGLNTVTDFDKTIYTICVPADTATTTQGTTSVNLNGNGNTNTPTQDNVTYYVDAFGNLYRDAKKTTRVSTTNCQDVVAKAFAPNEITGITTVPDYNYGAGQWLYVMKTWQFGGAYSKLDNFTSVGKDTIGYKLPAFVYQRARVAMNLPTTKVAVQTPTGSTTLCVPAKAYQADEYSVAFYDTTGKPYSDVFLQQPIACSDAANLCTNVTVKTCIMNPLNPCCTAPTKAVSAQ